MSHRWSENTAEDSVELAETAARYLSPKWEKKPRLILVVPKSKRGDLEPEPAEDHGNAPLTVLRDEVVQKHWQKGPAEWGGQQVSFGAYLLT